MGSDSTAVERDDKKIVLNLGCGFRKRWGAINVDGFEACKPDVLWDLNKTPYPWEDNSVYAIFAFHSFEHLENWWGAFKECARILQHGGRLEIRVPDSSSDSAITYRDHLNVLDLFSFHGTLDALKGRERSAWFAEQEPVPFHLVEYWQVPNKQYFWMNKWPWRKFRLLDFCAKHMRNFIWEQRFIFEKIDTSKYELRCE
jgi:SAM-dependent methyltransferase